MVGDFIAQLVQEKTPEKQNIQKIEVRLGSKKQRIELDALPREIGRYRLELVEIAKKEASFCVREVVRPDQDYKKIKSNSSSRSLCTPIITDHNWYGIAINAPGEIFFQQSLDQDFKNLELIMNKVPKVIVAGTYNYEYAKIDQRLGTSDKDLRLHIKDTSTGQAWNNSIRGIKRGYVGHVLGMNVSYNDREFPDNGGPEASGASKITAVGGYFNADIGMMLNRPKKPVDHEIHVEFGPYRSNTVIISVKP
ncbi:MAG: hypothetical protein JRF33_08995 [Deltaproteobacteria bacterium]|nr:hypothetical protein [Deltaproteobacteria bacterium]